MTRYLTKKRRNIKKYKKSRKGNRRGRRSVKRHTLGKRRRMVGGDIYEDHFNFNVDDPDLLYIIRNNKMYPVLKNVYSVKLVAYGIALVTNRNIGKLLRTDNRKEQINVFACYLDDNTLFCYAILRCPSTFCFDRSENTVFIPNYYMDDKILFLFVNQVLDIASSYAQMLQSYESVKGISYNVFQFNNRISSDHLYKILVPKTENDDANLNTFFNAVVEKNNFLEQKQYYGDLVEEIEKYPRQVLEQREKNRGSGARDAVGLGFGFLAGF
jgi:hypothetical protein